METKTTLPDQLGHYGVFGGRYVSETLMPAILQLEKAYMEITACNFYNFPSQ